MQAEHKAHGINDEMQNNFPLVDHHFEFRQITQQFKKSPAPAFLQALQGLNMQTMSAMAAHLPEGTLSSPQTEALCDRRQQALREAGLDGHNSPNSSTAQQTPRVKTTHVLMAAWRRRWSCQERWICPVTLSLQLQ